MKQSENTERKDDCCMTASVNNKGAYVVGQKKASAASQPKANSQRIAEAVKRTAAYTKK